MNSKQVLYAELELYALPNGTIRPVLQQSPYAQIVRLCHLYIYLLTSVSKKTFYQKKLPPDLLSMWR